MNTENPQFITTPDTLTADERRLFDVLAREPHRVFTKDELLRELLPAPHRPYGSTRRLDSVAVRLGRKLADFDGRRSPVNVWGVGYRLEDPR